DGFHVTANEDVPAEAVTTSGPIDEGTAETFTVNTIDPDTLDTVSVLVDWDGSGRFEELNPEDWTVNANGSISFSHVYDNNDAPQNVYAATIRVEDDGGQLAAYTVNVVVNDVAPRADLTAGYQFATTVTSGLNAWVINPGQTLAFDNVQVP